LSLGREVAAVPGPVTCPASRGANALLAAGAHLVTCAEDVLAIVGQARDRWTSTGDLDRDEQAVLAGLPCSSGSAGRWVEASGLPGGRARPALGRLLARGALRRLPGGQLARVL
jgi:DNA processing protein